jgi:hypothetical protein
LLVDAEINDAIFSPPNTFAGQSSLLFAVSQRLEKLRNKGSFRHGTKTRSFLIAILLARILAGTKKRPMERLPSTACDRRKRYKSGPLAPCRFPGRCQTIAMYTQHHIAADIYKFCTAVKTIDYFQRGSWDMRSVRVASIAARATLRLAAPRKSQQSHVRKCTTRA